MVKLYKGFLIFSVVGKILLPLILPGMQPVSCCILVYKNIFVVLLTFL